MDIFGTMFNATVGAALSALNNRWAAEQAELARRQNYMYGEMAAENADKRTRALYNDFYSPQALVDQYNKAGLSPSLMFGGTPGQGGQSGSQGSGASGIPTTFSPISLVDAAQAAALTAQAEKTKEEAATIKEQREPQTTKLWKEVENLVQQTDNAKVEGSILALQYDYDIVRNAIQGATANNEIEISEQTLKSIKRQNEILAEQYKIAKAQGEKEAGTVKAIIERAKLENQNLMADYMMKVVQTKAAQTGIKLTEAEVKKISVDCAKTLVDAKLQYANYKLDKDKLAATVKNWDKQNRLHDREVTVQEERFYKECADSAGNFFTNLIDAIIPF